MMSDQERGIYQKYNVTRTDGSSGPRGKHEHCAYFVLDLEHDAFAIPALKAYAKACRATHPERARDIETILDAEPKDCGCREAACPHVPMFGPANASEMASLLMAKEPSK